MFFLKKPDLKTVREFINSVQDESFSYPESGASRVAAPPGYNIDHNRIRLGVGFDTFTRASHCLSNWEMFELGWIELFPTHAPIEAGVTVAILVRHFGFWSLNASRIVYTIDKDPPVAQYGFAYGTLLSHAEQGEERFTIEHYQADDSVWYDLFAFSKPRHALAAAGYLVSRCL